MIELQQLTAAFDPLTAHTEGVKMALIISLSCSDLLEAAFSTRLLAVYHTHSLSLTLPPLRCHTASAETHSQIYTSIKEFTGFRSDHEKLNLRSFKEEKISIKFLKILLVHVFKRSVSSLHSFVFCCSLLKLNPTCRSENCIIFQIVSLVELYKAKLSANSNFCE